MWHSLRSDQRLHSQSLQIFGQRLKRYFFVCYERIWRYFICAIQMNLLLWKFVCIEQQRTWIIVTVAFWWLRRAYGFVFVVLLWCWCKPVWVTAMYWKHWTLLAKCKFVLSTVLKHLNVLENVLHLIESIEIWTTVYCFTQCFFALGLVID